MFVLVKIIIQCRIGCLYLQKMHVQSNLIKAATEGKFKSGCLKEVTFNSNTVSIMRKVSHYNFQYLLACATIKDIEKYNVSSSCHVEAFLFLFVPCFCVVFIFGLMKRYFHNLSEFPSSSC